MSLYGLVPKRFRRRHKKYKDVSKLPVTSSDEELLRLQGGDGESDLVALVIAFATANVLKNRDYYTAFKNACNELGISLRPIVGNTTRRQQFRLICNEVKKSIRRGGALNISQARAMAKSFVDDYMYET